MLSTLKHLNIRTTVQRYWKSKAFSIQVTTMKPLLYKPASEQHHFSRWPEIHDKWSSWPRGFQLTYAAQVNNPALPTHATAESQTSSSPSSTVLHAHSCTNLACITLSSALKEVVIKSRHQLSHDVWSDTVPICSSQDMVQNVLNAIILGSSCMQASSSKASLLAEQNVWSECQE